jgi:hypothetical protein
MSNDAETVKELIDALRLFFYDDDKKKLKATYDNYFKN